MSNSSHVDPVFKTNVECQSNSTSQTTCQTTCLNRWMKWISLKTGLISLNTGQDVLFDWHPTIVLNTQIVNAVMRSIV